MLAADVGRMGTTAGVLELTAAGVLISGGSALPAGAKTFQFTLTGTGALTAAFKVQGSNDGGTTWATLYENAALNGADAVADHFVLSADSIWGQIRANLSAITGTAASFKVYVAERRI